MEVVYANLDANFLIEVMTPRDNLPKSIAMEAGTSVEESEIGNPN
ncbi:hypothetical protein [Pseudoalteromonas sp. MMG005]|nr:hypothetical protein [Pseudoalteromonas sp. MMG005]